MAQVFRSLRAIAHPVVDVALAEALPTAERQARRLIVLSLLERRQDKAMASLVRHYHLLGKELQQAVIDHISVLDAALRTAGREQDPATRINVVDVVLEARAYHLSYLLAGQLHCEEPRVTRAAAAALLELVEEVEAEADGGRTVGARSIGWLGSALAEACACYHQHGRHDVLMAVARYIPRRHARLDQHLIDRRGAAQASLRELIRYADRTEIVSALLGLLALEPLRSNVLEAIARSEISLRLPELLTLAHLVVVPGIFMAVRRVPDAVHLLPTNETLAAMAPELQRSTVRWVRSVHVGGEHRLTALNCLAGSPDAMTRLLALKAMVDLSDRDADLAISSLCFDAEPAIARIAYRHLLHRRWDGVLRLSIRLVGSPHDELRRLAEQQLARTSFQRLWEQWEHLDPAMRLTAGRALTKIHPNFHEQLAIRLKSGEPDERFKAVTIVRQLQMHSYFEPRLIELAEDEHDKVASSAAAALGGGGQSEPTERTVETLKTALKHPDDRVRANAVESLEQLGRTGEAFDLLVEVAKGRGNRSRANALKALLNQPVAEALPALGAMLFDTDPRHRVSALWVAEQLDLARLGQQVGRLARMDDDPRVQRRAMRVLRKLARVEKAQVKA